MAEVDKDIVIKVKAVDEASAPIKGLEEQLNDVKQEMLALAAAGKANTAEFNKLAREAGGLKAKIEGVEKSVDGFMKTQSRVELFGSAVAGIAAGFAVAQGAAALFGEENEDLQKSIMKLQGAMALLAGVQQLVELTRRENVIGAKLAAAAQSVYTFAVGGSNLALKAFRIALVSTGVGAAVVAIGLLAANFDKLTEKVKKFIGIKVKENLDGQIQSMERQVEIMKARGDADIAVFNQEFELSRLRLQNAKNEEELSEARHQHNLLRAQYESFIKKRELDKQAEAEKKAEKDKAEREKKAEEAKRKREQDAEKAAEKQKEIDGIIVDSRQALLENSLSANERELEQIDASYEERFEKVKGNEEATNLLLAQLRAERLAKIQEQQDAADQAELDAQKAQLDYQIQIEDELYAEREKLRQEDLQREKAYNEARVSMYQTAAGSIVEIMRSLGGKSKGVMLAALALEKGTAIAQVIINLQKEIAGIKANAALNPANAVTAGATGLAQAASLISMAKISAAFRIATIAATGIGQGRSIAGGGDSGGGGGGGVSVPSGMAAPQGNAMNPNSQLLNPNTGQAVNPQPLRAYVVESDVSGIQNRLRTIRQFAQLGN